MWNDFLAIIMAVGIWYTLMRFIFPALGIPTCMSGACQIKRNREKETESNGGE